MKTKIISILAHTQAYELYAGEPPPEINWTLQNKQWAGILGYHGLIQLGEQILQITDDVNYEIWQPDLRVDKVYSHVFNGGVIYRLFPAKTKTVLYGLKTTQRIHSQQIISVLRNLQGADPTVVCLRGAITSGINKDIVANCERLPVIFSFSGEIDLPYVCCHVSGLNFLSKINQLLEYFWIQRNINRLKCIIYRNDKNLKHLKKIYSGRLEKLTSGCNFSAFRKIDRSTCRKELGLPMEKFIMITAARLVPLKQIDRFIRVLIRMPDRYDFLYLIAGHGTHGYEKYLYKIAGPLMEKGKIRFTGFLRNETLRKYLNSADLFVLTSTSEGCSVAVIEALACELPVFSTRTGDTAELMLQESAGCLVGINEYEKWEKGLREIFDGRKIDILDRNIAKQHYDWRNIAYRFIALCREILK